ncbi:Fe-S cluster assembly protein IscX [Anaplasma bovis]|uniref:Fe-S cluster assembly protein IscX n=1 Tax=Anaplasma bovis TaxID=186733 RepID=UPI002FEFF860
MKWTDTEDIVEALRMHYPGQDVFSLRFTELRDMVMGLPGFDCEGEECNEAVLEAIQMEWASEE